MKKIILSLLFILSVIICCEKGKYYDEGKVLFCTNSSLINCVFNIDIYINNDYSGTLTAASIYYQGDCSCPDSFFIGLTLEKEIGTYIYLAKETNCQGSNAVNNWTGEFEIKKNSCTMIFLDIIKEECTGYNKGSKVSGQKAAK